MRGRLICAAVLLAACGTEQSAPPRHGEPRLRRLLGRQYTNTVEALLGPEAAAVAKPPADIASRGFEAIGAAELAPSDMALGAYETSALAIAEAMVVDVSKLPPIIGCTPSGATDLACFDTFVRTFGRRAFRRPLAEDEVARYVGLTVTTAGRYHNAYAGVAYAIQAFLQSPYFLYQVEIGEVDAERPTRKRLTDYEVATRLSYFLLDTTPDDALLALAEQKLLSTPAQIRAAAEELLSRPAAKGALQGFFRERTKLRQVAALTKDPAVYPQFTPALAAAMEKEALLLLDDIVWTRDADYRDLFTADYAFVDAQLAALYGTAPVALPGQFEKRTLPAERRGMLGQAAFLSIEAHPNSTSPTRRGRHVSERLLCTDIPPPPPDVNTQLPMPVPGMPRTMRERLAAHTASAACADCHRRMDGIGLALEHFDGIGAFRATDQGLPIDATGEVVDVATFDGLPGLGALVRDLPDLHRCWVRGLYRHATGHIEADGDELALVEVDKSFGEAYRVKQLLLEITVSDAFRFVDNVDSVDNGEGK
ncbi:MAG: DUF1592 domain-containing protein [Deltaproteobacteria bacterium]|nr:DUF1592 domain-containing protein [Deltaproteobacteria bacterium]MCW5805119.1 DUF1592 domain-containing protein [Deltaproteobacteria bacterium]